jgi:hypothetical protein
MAPECVYCQPYNRIGLQARRGGGSESRNWLPRSHIWPTSENNERLSVTRGIAFYSTLRSGIPVGNDAWSRVVAGKKKICGKLRSR